MKKKMIVILAGGFILLALSLWAATGQSTDNGIGPVKDLKLGPIDKEMAGKGQGLFEEKCTMCHGLTEAKVGPALGDVLSEVTPEFVMNFLLNTSEMEQKDPRIVGLIGKYGMPMPPPNLDKDQARAILEYFRTTKKAGRP
jgi:cytochrome c